MPAYTTLTLSETEAREHFQTVEEAMHVLAKQPRPSGEVALLWQRLQGLRDLIARGLDEVDHPILTDVWQRPKVRQILVREGDERDEALTSWERNR